MFSCVSRWGKDSLPHIPSTPYRSPSGTSDRPHACGGVGTAASMDSSLAMDYRTTGLRTTDHSHTLGERRKAGGVGRHRDKGTGRQGERGFDVRGSRFDVQTRCRTDHGPQDNKTTGPQNYGLLSVGMRNHSSSARFKVRGAMCEVRCSRFKV